MSYNIINIEYTNKPKRDYVMTEFTPIASLIGGALIGLAAVMLMATNGRIAGVSGISSRLLPPNRSLRLADLAFLIGLIIAIPVCTLVMGTRPERVVSAGLPILILAGFAVGFGSTLGSGCTSGHGVCGISRLSARSIVATGTFMVTAFVTVFVTRHLLGGQ